MSPPQEISNSHPCASCKRDSRAHVGSLPTEGHLGFPLVASIGRGSLKQLMNVNFPKKLGLGTKWCAQPVRMPEAAVESASATCDLVAQEADSGLQMRRLVSEYIFPQRCFDIWAQQKPALK